MRVRVGVLACALPFLIGCSGAVFDTSNQSLPNSAGASLQGRVIGGQQPIVGSSIYMGAANTSGYGNASISLLTSASNTTRDGLGNYYVTSDSSGNFTITGDYTCTSGQQVYLYAIGGNPGSGTNSAAGLMAALGQCPVAGNFLATIPYIVVNEVSTVAAAYSLAGFAVDATHISSPGNSLALTGIANAFATSTKLGTLSTGVAKGPMINLVANILAACINSTGASSTACSTLFSNATNGSTAPVETATAAINIAHNPATNVANLFALSTASPPFAPSPTSQPNDFTVFFDYSASTLTAGALVIDASGNVFVGNTASNVITVFSNLGAVLSGSSGITGGLNGPGGGAIDTSGNAWVTSQNNNSVVKFASNKTVSTYTGDALNSPVGIAIDGSGNAWIANSGGNSVTELSSSGSLLSGAGGYTGGGLNNPNTLAIDGSGSAWVVNNGGNSVTKISRSGSILSGPNGYTGGLSQPLAIAVDSAGNAWIPNPTINSVTEISNSGTFLSGISGYTGGGLNGPNAVVIDGAGNAWISNYSGNSITEISNAGAILTGTTGLQPGLNTPSGIAIDGSGNVWIANMGANNVVEVIGAAVPVITPIAAGLPSTPTLNGTSSLGTRP